MEKLVNTDLARMFDTKNLLFKNINDYEKEISIYVFEINKWVENVLLFAKMLQTEELEMANRFKYNRERLNYIVRHGLLRMLLSKITGTKPDLIKLSAKRFQKPRLLFPFIKNFDFSCSSSGNYFAVVVSFNTELGIDVQKIDYSDSLYVDIAKQFFHREDMEAIEKEMKTEKVNVFFQIWTTKEAFLKLSQNFAPKSYASPSITGKFPISKTEINGLDLCFHCLEIDPDYKASVVYRI